jgi:hypothetical protein
VHALACGPKTHSQVVKAVGERMLKHRHGYFPHVRIQTLLELVMAQVLARHPTPHAALPSPLTSRLVGTRACGVWRV